MNSYKELVEINKAIGVFLKSHEEKITPCSAKHTEPQFDDREWKCPSCGSHGWEWHSLDSKAGSKCLKLHENDKLYCPNCNYSFSGREAAESYVRDKHLVRCPHCAGKGFIPKETEK